MKQARQALEPRLVSVAEAASYLAISQRGVWNLIAAGSLPSVRLGRRVLIDREQLDRLINASAAAGATDTGRP